MRLDTERHIHRVHDGLPRRRVFCDGEEIKRCIFADTIVGIVQFYGDELVMNEARDGFVLHQKKGKVEVYFYPETIAELTE